VQNLLEEIHPDRHSQTTLRHPRHPCQERRRHHHQIEPNKRHGKLFPQNALNSFQPIPKPLEKEPSFSPDFSTKSVSPSWRPLTNSTQSFPPYLGPRNSMPNLNTTNFNLPTANPFNNHTASLLQMQSMMSATQRVNHPQPFVRSNSSYSFFPNPITQYQAMLQSYQQYYNLINAASK
jgi:hypothetical protein